MPILFLPMIRSFLFFSRFLFQWEQSFCPFWMKLRMDLFGSTSRAMQNRHMEPGWASALKVKQQRRLINLQVIDSGAVFSRIITPSFII